MSKLWMKFIGSAAITLALVALAAIIFLPTAERNTQRMKTLSPHHFSIAVLTGAQAGEEDHLRNLIIYPVDVAADGRRLQYASGEIFVPRGAGGGYDAFSLCALLPFHYNVRGIAKGEAASLDEFVATARRGQSTTPFTFAWWASRKLVIGLWAFVGVVACGVVVRATWVAVRAFNDRRRAARQAALDAAALASAAPPPLADEGPAAPEPPPDDKVYKGEFYPVAQPPTDEA